MEVKTVMCRSYITTRKASTVKETVEKMAQKGALYAVVVEKKRPIGIFCGKELLATINTGHDVADLTMENVMRSPAPTIVENQDFFTAIRQTGLQNVWRFVVVDGEGALKGLVTEKEILAKFALMTFPFNMRLATLGIKGLSAPVKTPVKKIVSMMADTRQDCVTLLKNNKPAGIIDEHVLLKLVSKEAFKKDAEKIMRKILAISKSEGSVREAVIGMVEAGGTHIVLTDEKGFYQGIVKHDVLAKHIEKKHL